MLRNLRDRVLHMLVITGAAAFGCLLLVCFVGLELFEVCRPDWSE
jgi:hypothetical protein